MDRLTKKQRSELMSKIRSVSAMEIRARGIAVQKAKCVLMHQPKNIVGRPDYGNASKKVAVFIHGCFWHKCPLHWKMPKTNKKFWANKFAKNVRRHASAARSLRKIGYKVIVIWEHKVRR